ncbi:MAG: Gfo/Idh/MocA family oxidoreductase [Planctomycetota bacterium]
MMKTWRFGIIGCGAISDFHARAIQDLKNAKLVAACSRAPANTARISREFGATPYDNAEAMLDRKDIDIVTICTPSGAHLEYVRMAAERGRHVIVEKPLETTLLRCDEAIRACRKAGVTLGVIFPSRFHEASALVKQAVDTGRLGRITLGDAYVKWWRTQDYYDKGGWKGTQKLDGGGALMNQSIHNVDLLQWFMGRVTSVASFTATLAHERIEVEDTAVAALRFESGALGVLEGATSAFPGFLKKIEISGTQGTVVLEEEDILVWSFAREEKGDAGIREKFARRTSGKGGAADPMAIKHDGHRRQIGEFLQALESGREPLVNGEEGRKSVEIVLAVYASQAQGRAVALPL